MARWAPSVAPIPGAIRAPWPPSIRPTCARWSSPSAPQLLPRLHAPERRPGAALPDLRLSHGHHQQGGTGRPAIKAAVNGRTSTSTSGWLAPHSRGHLAPAPAPQLRAMGARPLLTHGEYDAYWRQRGYAISHYYERARRRAYPLPGRLVRFVRPRHLRELRRPERRKRSRQVLLMGPWTHGGWGVSDAGDVDFGTHPVINYNDLRLAWFDHFLKTPPHRKAPLAAGRSSSWAPGRCGVDGRPNYQGRSPRRRLA